jgi:hypothetical protein
MKLFYLLFLINQVLSIPIITPYDEHNCCISCGYTYCPTLLECIREWETECPKLINPFIIDK